MNLGVFDYFFEISDKNGVQSRLPTVFLRKLRDDFKDENSKFDLSKLWILWSNHAPSGPLNGGVRMVAGLKNIASLFRYKLIDFVFDDDIPKEKQIYSANYFFTMGKSPDSPHFLEEESPEFDSKFCRINQDGIDFVNILDKFEDFATNMLSEYETDAQDICEKFLRTMFGDDKKSVEIFGRKLDLSVIVDFAPSPDILIDEILRVMISGKKCNVLTLSKTVYTSGCYNFGVMRAVFKSLEYLCSVGKITRKKTLTFELSDEGEKLLSFPSDIDPKSLKFKLDNLYKKFGKKISISESGEEKNCVQIPAEYSDFVSYLPFAEVKDEVKTLFTLISHDLFHKIPEEVYTGNYEKQQKYDAQLFVINENQIPYEKICELSYISRSILQLMISNSTETHKVNYAESLFQYLNCDFYDNHVIFKQAFGYANEVFEEVSK